MRFRKVDPKNYPNIVAHGTPELHENVAWYATDDDRVLGVVVRDKIDNDFGWVVLGEDPFEPPGLRAVNMATSRPTVEACLGELFAAMAAYRAEGFKR